MLEQINCLIIDDEPIARGIIRNYCAHVPIIHIAGEFGNALEARSFLEVNTVDLLFLDIHMPVLNGIGFLNTLKDPPKVIFTTAYQEYAVNAFDLDACDYLLKPFSFDRFMIAIDKVKHKCHVATDAKQPAVKDAVFIKSESKIYQVPYQQCLYAEAQGNYTKVVTISNTLLTKVPFSAFCQQLPCDAFIKVHRSFIINKHHINHMEGNRIFIRQVEIPISAQYKHTFFRTIGFDGSSV